MSRQRSSTPTARAAQVWEAVHRLGKQQLAADELGISRGVVRHHLDAYMAASGIVGRRPSRRNLATDQEMFDAIPKVTDPATGCIIWLGGTHTGGYGRCNRKSRPHYAHREAWRLAHGPIPAGMVVRHRCDNPPCVNVEHLELGTQGDNIRDIFERDRRPARTACFRGHPYAADTHVYRGYRVCQECRAITNAARKARAA